MRRIARAVIAIGAFVGSMIAPCSGDVPAGAVQTAQAQPVALYQWNIHAMENDWRGWIEDVRSDPELAPPDVIFVQDLQANRRPLLLRALSEDQGFAGEWSARLFVPNARAGAMARAVVWRADRFRLLALRTFRGYGGPAGGRRCTRADNAGAVQVVLQDRNDGNVVSATSLKTPHKRKTDACAWRNSKLLAAMFGEAGWGGDLMVIGTDTNAPDRGPGGWKCWYRGTAVPSGRGCGGDGNRSFVDPILSVCQSSSTSHDELLGCLERERTNRAPYPLGGRIDFLFAAAPEGREPAVVAARTLPMGPPDCDNHAPGRVRDCFSDHRAVHAVFTVPVGDVRR
jgi:hypothetical protein